MNKRSVQDADLEENRTLLEQPTEFEDGMTMRAALGALFIGSRIQLVSAISVCVERNAVSLPKISWGV